VKDPVEIQRRIERLVKRVRRRDDYGMLLATGQAIRPVDEVEDPDAWRAEIKRQARSDRIKVRTGITGGTLWALTAGPLTEAQREEDTRYFHLYHRLESDAKARGHVFKVALRDGEEAVFRCERCGALGYADAASGPLIGGQLFESDCPGEELPDAIDAG
jgi:hypothetical protein